MTLSISDAVSLESIARTDPFSEGSMFKDPSAAATAQFSGMSAQLTSISSLPGLDNSLKVKFDSLTSSMSDYTSNISSTMADRMATFTKDMSVISNAIDLYDESSPCGMINSVFGSIAKIGDMMSSAMDSIKKTLKPITDALGAGFDKLKEAGSWMLDKLHGAMDAIGSAIDTAVSYVSKKLTEFTNMVSKELSALGKMIGDLVDLSYLDELRNLSICGAKVMDACSS